MAKREQPLPGLPILKKIILSALSAQFHNSKSISIEDFQKKYLSDVDEKDMWEQFKADLWQEVEDGKISKIKYHRIINKRTQEDLP